MRSVYIKHFGLADMCLAHQSLIDMEVEKKASVNATYLKTRRLSRQCSETLEYLLRHTLGWDQSKIFGRVWVSNWCFHLLGFS